jgi:2-keto-4-pentenoate hydratase
MQAMCGIDTPWPASCSVTVSTRRAFAWLAQTMSRFGIEFEIVVRIDRDLRPIDRPFALADVQDTVDAVAPAIEIVDDRCCA